MTLRTHILRLNPLCVTCQRVGRLTAATEVDHIDPLHKGGSNSSSNLQGLCHDCHAAKTAADLGQRVRVQIGADGWPIGEAGK